MLFDSPIFHSNRYHADAVCIHCSGIVRHQAWCITTNKAVLYAYEVAIPPEKMDDSDRRILHTLGVIGRGLSFCVLFKSRLTKEFRPLCM